MLRSEARIRTGSAHRYAKQLCSHLAHRARRAEWTPPDGVVEFPQGGTCRIWAGDDELVLVAEGDSPAELATVREVAGGHLERFAHRDGLQVSWSA